MYYSGLKRFNINQGKTSENKHMKQNFSPYNKFFS